MKAKYLVGFLTILFLSAMQINNYSRRNTTPKYNWKGNYINEYGIQLNISDPKSDGTMKFDLIQNGPNCLESIHGIAKLDKPDIATYTERDTMIITLMYKQKPEEVNVSEFGYTHGSNCNAFYGTYKKKREE